MNNLDKLEKIFPECITETTDADGNLIRAVDFERFKQIFSDSIAEGREAYVFNFVGKKRAELEAHKPIDKTLRPIISESRDFNTTQNLYIEGDNLDAMKILLESYLGKVKMIYIDPPYNTGNDFIYRDDFTQDEDAYDDAAGILDDTGNRLFANKESNGRFHSDWCAMIYSRLLLAKHFLSNDGVIFISIDDHEQANLKKICDEVFGEKNFIGDLIWESTTQPTNAGSAKFGLQKKTENILLYAKSKSELKGFHLEEIQSTLNYPHKGRFGACRFEIIETSDAGTYGRSTMKFKILGQAPRAGKRWKIGEETARQLEKSGRIEIIDGIVKKAVYPEDEFDKRQFIPFWSLLTANVVGTAQVGKEELNSLFEISLGFDTVKPVNLLKKLLYSTTDADSIVMDFFSGSATTAHAVMELNAQDGGHRKFIMIQLPEVTPDNSEAFRAGFKNICDIGKERIRRAGDKIKAENPEVDTGFRVFRVDSSNYLPLPSDINQLILMAENIKDDRTAEDLFFGELLETGLPIDSDFAAEILDGVKVLSYRGGEILACFDRKLPAETFHKLASRKPRKIIFRDSCFASSAAKINALEYFKIFAPDTEIKVL